MAVDRLGIFSAIFQAPPIRERGREIDQHSHRQYFKRAVSTRERNRGIDLSFLFGTLWLWGRDAIYPLINKCHGLHGGMRNGHQELFQISPSEFRKGGARNPPTKHLSSRSSRKVCSLTHHWYQGKRSVSTTLIAWVVCRSSLGPKETTSPIDFAYGEPSNFEWCSFQDFWMFIYSNFHAGVFVFPGLTRSPAVGRQPSKGRM